MTTSASNNYNTTRTEVITRALRIINAIGQGETPDSAALTDAVPALNDLIMEWNTDGMPQWNMELYVCTPLVLDTASYDIGPGATFDFPAPLKIIQAYLHDTVTDADTPVQIIDRQRYLMLGNKTSSGQPSQLFYQTPRAIQATGESFGEIILFPVPDATTVASKDLIILAQKPFDDMDDATDTFDFPPYWLNALTWGLAEALSYEYGLGLAERSMIAKQAEKHKEAALSFGTEEGSMYLQPEANWDRHDR